MRNLGYTNDLYNAQDVILLCEIIEKRFQIRHEKNGFNSRKCNSASTLSGCIEKEMSKVIIALPASNEVVDIFEKTLTSGFSCVNIRLAFDAEFWCQVLLTRKSMKATFRKKITATNFVIS